MCYSIVRQFRAQKSLRIAGRNVLKMETVIDVRCFRICRYSDIEKWLCKKHFANLTSSVKICRVMSMHKHFHGCFQGPPGDHGPKGIRGPKGPQGAMVSKLVIRIEQIKCKHPYFMLLSLICLSPSGQRRNRWPCWNNWSQWKCSMYYMDKYKIF